MEDLRVFGSCRIGPLVAVPERSSVKDVISFVDSEGYVEDKVVAKVFRIKGTIGVCYIHLYYKPCLVKECVDIEIFDLYAPMIDLNTVVALL